MKPLFKSFIAPISALFMGATNALAEESSPQQALDNPPLIELADQGNNFDDSTREFNNNKAIQDIDDKIQTIISKIFDVGNEEITDLLYYSYGDKMDRLGSDYTFDQFNLKDERIDLCTSKSVTDFFKNHLEKIEQFMSDNPGTLPNSILNDIEALKPEIAALEKINEREGTRLHLEEGYHPIIQKYPCGYGVA